MIDLLGAAHPNYSGEKLSKTIIAPIGYARVGKDEFAKVLVEEYGFTRFAFADKLRECLSALNPIIATEYLLTNPPKPVTWHLEDIIDEWGWDGYKESPFADEIRRLLQRFGTEVGRDLLAEDIWLRELDRVDADKIVITDARFPNELQHVLDSGGTLVHIRRKGVNPINAHISETAHLEYAIDAPFVIENFGSLDTYRADVREFADSVL